MTQLQPVIWSKGTFLTPQHLQIQDRFIENTLRFQLEALNFRPYGFQRLQIDHEGLAAGKFSVSSASGIFQSVPYFVPPLLDFSASEYLVSMLRRLIEILSAKSSQLAGGRRQKNQSLADFTASDIANFWLLHTINSNFPALNHIFEAKKCHPERLFSAMRTLAGSLTTFSS